MLRWYLAFTIALGVVMPDGFLVQNSQNRDSGTLHVKLDEIINVLEEADDKVINAEEDTQEELDEQGKIRLVVEALSRPVLIPSLSKSLS